MQHPVRIKSIHKITHNVLRIVTEKPSDYNFVPGQATEISMNRNGWIDKKRPFTFTCLPSNDYLEFTIKTYPSHRDFTNELLQCKNNDELILHDVFGAIHYQSEGVFIAGGAGVTPFISIFRDLQSKSKSKTTNLFLQIKLKSILSLKVNLKICWAITSLIFYQTKK